MNIEVSAEVESRLMASAQAEGLSVSAFLERVIDERDELAAAINRVKGYPPPLPLEELQKKVDRAFVQSERRELVDGDTFTAKLLSELDDTELQQQLK